MNWFWKMLGWDLYRDGPVMVWVKGSRGRGGYDAEVRQFMATISAVLTSDYSPERLRFVLRFTD